MPKRNLAWILIVVAITLLVWQLPQLVAGRDSVLHAFGALVDARAQIHRRYVREPDDDRLSRAAVDAGIRAMVRELNDPYAVFLNRDEFAAFQARTDGRYGGIGVEVGCELITNEDRGLGGRPAPRGAVEVQREPKTPALAFRKLRRPADKAPGLGQPDPRQGVHRVRGVRAQQIDGGFVGQCPR